MNVYYISSFWNKSIMRSMLRINRFLKLTTLFSVPLCTSNKKLVLKPPWNVLFFGTDNFSLRSLEQLFCEYRKENLIKNLEVVTSIKSKPNVVHKFATSQKLVVHKWPCVPPEEAFHIGVVVSFGHLIPESVINQFPLGMLNVHASLLPKWRGAAPIVHAIANGDTKTGVTIMRIKPRRFDVGEIVQQAQTEISEDMQMPELYEKLAHLGSQILLEVIKSLPEALETSKEQNGEEATLAPRIKSDFGQVQWDKMNSVQVYNLARALKSLYPLQTSWNGIGVKLMEVARSKETSVEENYKPGFVEYDKLEKVLKVLCADRKWIFIKRIGVVGKPVMSAIDFNNGYVNKEDLHRRYFT